MTDEQRVRELLEQILETHCAPEVACSKCPELLPKVLLRLKRMRGVEQQLDALFPSSDAAIGKNGRTAYAPSDRLPQIEGYEVERILGYGGMGVVYTARHLKLNRTVALKMLLAGPYAGPQEVARYLCVNRRQWPNSNTRISCRSTMWASWTDDHSLRWNSLRGGSLAQEARGRPAIRPTSLRK